MSPRWTGTGDELFFRQRSNIISVPVGSGTEFPVGAARKLFAAIPDVDLGVYDVSADGQRFLARRTVREGQAVQPTITWVQNWYAEFEKPENRR